MPPPSVRRTSQRARSPAPSGFILASTCISHRPLRPWLNQVERWFATVNVDGGTLDIGVAGSLDGVQNATVASGASLAVDGAMMFTAGADTFTVAGDVSGSGTLDMLDGDDHLILQDGADLSGLANAIDGGSGTDTLTPTSPALPPWAVPPTSRR